MGGSSRTEKAEIPAYMEEAGQFALEKAKQIDALGKLPYMGPEVAAVNPYEAALARNVGGMASAFGLEAPAALDMGGMETVTQGGLTGYSSYPAYMASMERLRETRPDQYAYFAQMTGFDPITGAAVAPPPTPVAAPVAAPVSSGGGGGGGESTAEALERHYRIFPETRPTTGPYAAKPSGMLDTKGQIGKYSTPSHGMSFADQVKADLGYAAATAKKDVGKLFGGLFGG
jgi:hypothetical protein|tara:strand:- start:18221 stop:18910 length:690 start_codon:yes stop_codon:yes gene_type:complete